MTNLSRRHVLAVLLVVSSFGLGGCLTLSPTVGADTAGSSAFKKVSTSEPWSSGRVRTSVTLTPDATTTGDVSELTVVSASGTTFDTVALDTGQTAVTIYVPGNARSTIVASDATNATTIETKRVTAGGDHLF